MTIGVLGAGQLGRMLALAGTPLGLRFRFLDPVPDAPAAQVGVQIVDSYDDPAALDTFSRGLSAVTYEFENVPSACAAWLAERLPVYPPPRALAAAQDRIAEKTLFQQLGIAVPRFAPVDGDADLERAISHVGLPAVMKTRRMGYDGKGQAVVRTLAEARAVFSALAGRSRPAFPTSPTPPTSAGEGATHSAIAGLILEQFVPFERELSIIAVRSQSGEVAFYPLIENHHSGGILRLSLAPAPNLRESLQQLAERHAAAVLARLSYVGVLAIEFFQVSGDDGAPMLMANEMAPRVHNSGHWSIEGAITSQFENHVRAVAGYPLGSTSVPRPAAMLNLIGSIPDHARVLAIPGAHLHLYGKSPRPGRKVGHINMISETSDELHAVLDRLRSLLPS